MKYIKLLEEFEPENLGKAWNNAGKNVPNSEESNKEKKRPNDINKATLTIFSNSLINNTFLKRKGENAGVMKINGIRHEDGSGKTFIIETSLYDSDKKYIENKRYFYRLIN